MQTYESDMEKLLAEGNSIQIKPRGYSMYPLLVPGRDAAVISPLEKGRQLKRGDVVLYRRYTKQGAKDILVLHRIWKVDVQGVFLVGDNQKEVEGPLKQEQILGIAIQIIRKERRISTRNAGYRLITGIWLMLRPLRPLLSRTAAKCKGFVRKNSKDINSKNKLEK